MAAVRILLIEDRPETQRFLAENLHLAIPGLRLEMAADAETAEALFFREGVFDLTLLDLEIPAGPDDVTPNIVHGERLLTVFRNRSPGSPLCVLTAHGTMEHANAAFTGAATPDVYGDPSAPTLCFINKDQMRNAIKHARTIADILGRFDSIRVRVEPGDAADEVDLRILQRYAVFFEASRLVASRFGSGLSSAKAFSVKLFGDDGTTKALLAVKIGLPDKIADEIRRYDQYVAPLLAPNALAPLVASPITFGRKAGVAYRLLDSRELTLFKLAALDIHAAVKAIAEVEAIELGWLRNIGRRDLTVKEVRQALVPDAELNTEQRDAVRRYSDYENRTLQMRTGLQHGDSHGDNILCSQTGEATLIDYADVGRLLPPADPVMLELSFIFHPSARVLSTDWPTRANLSAWRDVNAFVSGCPFAAVLRRCREWSNRLLEPISDDGLCVSAYSYAIWQLGFGPARRDDLHALISGLI